jgi:hypothetical protein
VEKSQIGRKKIENSIDKIYKALIMDEFEEHVKEYVKKIELDEEKSETLKSQIGISGKFSLEDQDISIGGSLGVSDEDKRKERQKIELVIRGLAVIDYEMIRNELDNIIDLCGAKGIILLVDEWSSVSLPIQPILAEMIRKTLLLSDRISLKLAATKFQTQTNASIDSPQGIGLQPGVDIVELAYLDTLLNFDIEWSSMKDFLIIIAYKHICHYLPILKNHSIQDFEEYLNNEIFEGKDAFREVIRASEGNPRDFLQILIACCNSSIQNDKIKLSKRQVIHVASTYFYNTKLSMLKNNKFAITLYEKIFQIVVKGGRKAFLVSRKKAEQDVRLQELWHNRFIHLIDLPLTIIGDDRSVKEYMIYSMDYGRFLSLKSTKAGGELFDRIMSVSIFLEDIAIPIMGRSIAEVVAQILRETGVTRPLDEFIGTKIISINEVDEVSVEDIDYLMKNCLIDGVL